MPPPCRELAVDGEPGSDELMSGVAANAESLDLREVGARYVDQVGTVAADGSWSAVAEVAWQVEGDTSPSQADVVVSFAPDGDGLGITGFGGADAGRGRVPLWLRGELSVARSRGVLVMVDGTRSEADEVAARVTRGIDVVRRVLPAWRAPVVVEVPASAADLDETLGAEPGTYAGIAAVTATAGSATDDTAPVHVFVNPEVTAGLRRAGAQVVMSHELVHVATDAARGGTEPWLVEGFADYVALRDTGLPDRATSAGRSRPCAATASRTTCPGAADFDTRAADLQARYEEAWLACRIIAERLGERELWRCTTPPARARPRRWHSIAVDFRRTSSSRSGGPASSGSRASGTSRARSREITEGDRCPVAFSVESRVMRVACLVDPRRRAHLQDGCS